VKEGHLLQTIFSGSNNTGKGEGKVVPVLN